jgi:hypothetical protein
MIHSFTCYPIIRSYIVLVTGKVSLNKLQTTRTYLCYKRNLQIIRHDSNNVMYSSLLFQATGLQLGNPYRPVLSLCTSFRRCQTTAKHSKKYQNHAVISNVYGLFICCPWVVWTLVVGYCSKENETMCSCSLMNKFITFWPHTDDYCWIECDNSILLVIPAQREVKHTFYYDCYPKLKRNSGICVLIAKSHLCMRFQVLTATSMKFRFAFWDVLPCKIIFDQRFRGIYCLHHPCWWRQYVSLKCRLTIILYGSTSQKTILNIILAVVRTWNLTIPIKFPYQLVKKERGKMPNGTKKNNKWNASWTSPMKSLPHIIHVNYTHMTYCLSPSPYVSTNKIIQNHILSCLRSAESVCSHCYSRCYWDKKNNVLHTVQHST